MKWNVHLAFAAVATLSLTACDAEALLRSSDLSWLWLVVPLASFLLVGVSLVYARRPMQSQALHLRSDPAEPRVKGILLAAIVIGLALAVAFAIYNYRLEIDPRQKIWNIGLWFLGTSFGTSLALVLVRNRT